MLNATPAGPRGRVRGVTMIEVLIALFVLTVGMLGAANLQFRMQTAEREAYQRTQAIVLLQDMVARINANRKNVADYATAAPLGTGATLDCSAPLTLAEQDRCAWHNALLGEGETSGGAQLGAMDGARGCIEVPVATMPRRVVVSVAWQGMSPTVSPGATACGQGTYGSDDRFRRAMVASITIGCLQNDPGTGICVTP
ncbi:MAG TPA: type IV pilus modification protein PilV [Burkholderiales bacterium]|nr:type IV pilus modification protein PilV [Burkholderiales bacterium]